MADSKLQPHADLKYKARTYTDKDGKEKGVWIQVGTLFSTPHGSHMSIKLDTVPVGEWNGWLSVFPREGSEDVKPKQDVIQEVGDDPISLDDIPF